MELQKTLNMQQKFSECLINEAFERVELGINRKNLNFAILKLNANKFNTDKLINFLANAAIFYAIPAKRINELKKDGLFHQLNKEAAKKFRNTKFNDGEGGELISYCINEEILKAPKLLSKLKLKTNNNDYVKGADGIHILKLSETQYEIIYAESKMYINLDTAIDKAFESIDRFIGHNGTEFEVTTLATNLSGEFEDIDVEYISKYILPSKNNVNHNTAFSIFIGFEIENTIDASLEYDDFQRQIFDYVKSVINEKVGIFAKKLNDEKRKFYSFYIYLIPFTNIEEVRRGIIAEIKDEHDRKNC